MHEILLQYLGKKNPCVIDTPVLKTSPIKFTAKEPTWVNAGDAEWLMKTNPKMFRRVDERGKEELEDASEIIAKKEADNKAEEIVDEDFGLEVEPEIDRFDGMTRKQISDEALEKFEVEIKIAGKNLDTIKSEYLEAEKNFMGR